MRAIPRGKVTTYGELAELAGIQSGHRVVEAEAAVFDANGGTR